MSLSYTQEFIDKVKEIFPSSPQIHQMLRTGDPMLGHILSEAGGKIRPETIVAAFQKGEEKSLLKNALNSIAAENLYQEWLSTAEEVAHGKLQDQFQLHIL